MGGDFLYICVTKGVHLEQLSQIKGTVSPKGKFRSLTCLRENCLGFEMTVFQPISKKALKKKESEGRLLISSGHPFTPSVLIIYALKLTSCAMFL